MNGGDMSRIPRFLLIAFVLVMVVALVGWAQTAEQGAKAGKQGGAKAEKAAAAKGNAKEGATVFGGKCATCHGKDGSGNTTMGKNMKIIDLRAADVQNKTDAQLAEAISKGMGKMPGYKILGEEKINDVVAYIRALKK
jgi:mono/diheme cytochrome c family protein